MIARRDWTRMVMIEWGKGNMRGFKRGVRVGRLMRNQDRCSLERILSKGRASSLDDKSCRRETDRNVLIPIFATLYCAVNQVRSNHNFRRIHGRV